MCDCTGGITDKRPEPRGRKPGKNRPKDAVILGTFLVIGVSGFLAEGMRIALKVYLRRRGSVGRVGR